MKNVWFNFLVPVILVVFMINTLIIQHLAVETDKNKFDFKCVEEGYEKATDYRYRTDNSNIVMIECDKDKIIYATSREMCGKFDKWGDCLSYKKVIE